MINLTRPFTGNYPITQAFGNTDVPDIAKYAIHQAVDYGLPVNTPVLAMHPGVVRKAESDPYGRGQCITLELAASGVITVYAHLDCFLVKAGQTVDRGQVIARSGNTGNSTGPHLHVELYINGEAADPELYYDAETTAAPNVGAKQQPAIEELRRATAVAPHTGSGLFLRTAPSVFPKTAMTAIPDGKKIPIVRTVTDGGIVWGEVRLWVALHNGAPLVEIVEGEQ